MNRIVVRMPWFLRGITNRQLIYCRSARPR